MRKSPIVALLILIMTSFSALGADVTMFEGGLNKAVANMNQPEPMAIINITLPAECHVKLARMNVSSLIPNTDISGYPEDVKVFLNDSLLWEFNGTTYGSLGMQNEFVSGLLESKSVFSPNGGVNTENIRLPKSATVNNATMEINFKGPFEIQQYANFLGSYAGEGIGESISTAGDVNGDGYDDFLIGSPTNDIGGIKTGKVYLYYGGAKMNSTPDLTFSGAAPYDEFGGSVASAGDVNKDGYNDVIVGAHNNDIAGTNAGRAYIYYGGSNMNNIADVILTGAAPYDYFGYSVSRAGDVNKDGYGDVIVGAYCNSTGGNVAGRAYVFYGGVGMDTTADVFLTGTAGDYLGYSVSGDGDLNNDGYDDVIVGTRGTGKAQVYLGGATMDGVVDLVLSGTSPGESYGTSVSVVGDLNHDGYDDVVVGAPWALSNTGKAYVYCGGASMDNSSDVVLIGANPGDYLGTSVSGVRDMNYDGYDEVIAGAYSASEDGPGRGRAYIYNGSANMDNSADVILSGAAAGDFFGTAVSDAGDVDRDGSDEVAVSAILNGAGGKNAGNVTIYNSYAGISGSTVFIGPKSILDNTSIVYGTVNSYNLSSALNHYLAFNSETGTDKYNTQYTDVPVTITSKAEGIVTLSNLTINYSFEAQIWDFTAVLDQYISDHKMQKDLNGNLTVPIKVSSRTPGRLGLNDLMITVDEPPKFNGPIPDVELQEDSINSQLVDLYDYFTDDYTFKDKLDYKIISATNSSIVHLDLIDNRYISANASDGSLNDNWTGELDVVVGCSDELGLSTLSNTFRIVVTNVNDGPFIMSTPPATAISGQQYLYSLIAVDGDNDTLTYILKDGPDNMTVNSNTGLISWMPLKHGIYEVSVMVSDGILNATQTFQISVPNSAPRITNMVVPTARTNEYYSYDIPAVDDDGDPMTFTLLKPVDAMVLDLHSGRINWTSKAEGEYPVSVAISDGQDTTTYNFTIKVVQGNHQPVFSSTPLTFGFLGLPYVYDANATDVDSDTIVFVLLSNPTGMTIDTATGKINWTPTGTGNFSVKIGSRDGKGGEGIQEFNISVKVRTKAKVEYTTPTESQTVKGKFVVVLKVTKGNFDIAKVQLRIDSGEWIDIAGNGTWQYSLDTTKLKNGDHILQARAYDGMDYSTVMNRTVTVDNQKTGGKQFIPGFGHEIVIVMVISMVLILLRRTKRRDPSCSGIGAGREK